MGCGRVTDRLESTALFVHRMTHASALVRFRATVASGHAGDWVRFRGEPN